MSWEWVGLDIYFGHIAEHDPLICAIFSTTLWEMFYAQIILLNIGLKNKFN